VDVPVTATIRLDHLRHNVRTLQAEAGPTDLMAVVKADAYGHGAERVVRTLQEEGVHQFAVARVAEGTALREAGITDPILVLGAPTPDDLAAYRAHDLDVTVSSPAVADAILDRSAAGAEAPWRVHVKVDTGMGRIGLDPDDAAGVVQRLYDAPHVRLVGLWTHFATADEPESAFAEAQLDAFRALANRLGDLPQRVHAANSSALFTLGARLESFQPAFVRTGIALYGLADRPALADAAALRPVMALTSRVTHLKTVAPGTSVSYGRTWTADRPTRVATVGAGYGDGYPRLCSGRADVRIRGTRRPVIGTICMDMFMVDLGPPDAPLARAAAVGDPVTLFGAEAPTAFDVADWAETIPYEVCTGISPRVPRRYVDAS
jgi:alanine racemase